MNPHFKPNPFVLAALSLAAVQVAHAGPVGGDNGDPNSQGGSIAISASTLPLDGSDNPAFTPDEYSIAIGSNARSGYAHSIAIGHNVGIYDGTLAGIVLGYNSSAYGSSIALGTSTGASGYYNLAASGATTDVGVIDSFAFGRGTFIQASNSIEGVTMGSLALGPETRIDRGAYGGIALGGHASIGENSTRSVVIGAGNDVTDHSAVGPGSSRSVVVGASSSVGYESFGAIALGTSTQVGNNALYGTAIGFEASANAADTIAIGHASRVESSAINSIAIGHGSSVFQFDSLSIGSGSTAQGARSVSLGNGSYTAGQSNVAVGAYANTQPGAEYSIAIGAGTLDSTDAARVGARAVNAIALGHNANIGQDTLGAIAIGASSRVADEAQGGVALGLGSTVLGTGSVALGNGSVARGDYTVSFGDSSADGFTRRLTNISAGSAATDAVNLGQLNSALSALSLGMPSFSAELALGLDAVASGNSSTAVGVNTRASQPHAAAYGENARAEGNGSLALGANSSASGFDSLASGSYASASGHGGSAYGAVARARGRVSTSLGDRSLALAEGSSALSAGATVLSGSGQSIAIGGGTDRYECTNIDFDGNTDCLIGTDAARVGINAPHSIALGYNARVHDGAASAIAFGDGAAASGVNSIAFGAGSRADYENSIAIGTGSSTTEANTVSFGGGGATSLRLVNLAPGRAPTDAATVGQVVQVNTSLQASLGLLDGRVRTLESSGTGSGGSGGGASAADLMALQTQVNAQMTRLTSAESGLAAVNNTLPTLADISSVQGLDARQVALAGRVMTVESGLSGLRTRADGSEADIASLQMTSSQQNARLNFLELGAGSGGGASPELVSTVIAQGEQLQAQAGDIDALQAQTARLNAGRVVIGSGATATAPSGGLLFSNGALIRENTSTPQSNIAIGRNASAAIYGQYRWVNEPNGRPVIESGDTQAVAIGDGARAGRGSTVIGTANAMASFSVAIGSGASVSPSAGPLFDGRQSGVAIGDGALVDRVDRAVALGAGAQVTGMGFNSAAIGSSAVASARDSVALGTDSRADQANTVSVGNANRQRRIVNVADGTAASDAATVRQVNAVRSDLDAVSARLSGTSIGIGAQASVSGTGSIALGQAAQTTGSNAIALGHRAQSIRNAVAFGTEASATDRGTAIGHQAVAATGAVALGSDARAQSLGGTAIGNGATVNPIASSGIAIGSGFIGSFSGNLISSETVVRAERGVAIGYGSTVGDGGRQAVVLGTNSVAHGADSIVLGTESIARNTDSIAVGHSSAANGFRSVALGNASVADAAGASALADQARATGFQSTALGAVSRAEAAGSVALGAGSVATAENTVSVGNSNLQRRIVNVAAGTSTTDAANVGQVRQVNTRVDGLEQRLGMATPTSGEAPRIQLGNSTAQSAGAIAVGDGALAMQADSIAIGSGAVARSSVAIGVDALAAGTNTTALGDRAQATGNFAVAVGNNSRASADNSVAIGNASTATEANTVSVGSAGSERRVTNVAAGSAATDAANTAQVQAVQESVLRLDGRTMALEGRQEGLNERVGNLDAQLSETRKAAYQGVAIVAALAQPIAPNSPNGALNVGVANYKGITAFGVSATGKLLEGRTLISIGAGSAGNGGNTAVRMGVSLGF